MLQFFKFYIFPQTNLSLAIIIYHFKKVFKGFRKDCKK